MTIIMGVGCISYYRIFYVVAVYTSVLMLWLPVSGVYCNYMY